MKKLTEKEREFINKLNHKIYTVDEVERLLNTETNIVVNAPLCLMVMGAEGYYTAVKQMIEKGYELRVG